METVAELEAKLVKAKAQQVKEQNEKFWAEVREKLHNRAFVLQKHAAGNGYGYVAYKLYSQGKDREPRVESVSVNLYSAVRSRWPDHCGFYCAPGYPNLNAENPQTLNEVLYKHAVEITLDRFAQVRAMAITLADAMTKQLMAGEKLPPDYQAPPDLQVEKWELDVPHVAIPTGLTSWLEGPYMAPGDRYILTANSKQFARTKIADARATVRRIEHLFEECDMRYLSHKADQFRQIEALLQL